MENNILKVENKETLTSLELLEQINFFRNEIEGKKPLEHRTLLRTIRDEFEEEIGRNKIVQSYYINSQNKEQPMFELTLSQAKQVLVRESKAVRKAVIRYIEELENQINKPQLDERTIAVMGIMNSNSDLEKALAIKDFEKIITVPLLETIEKQQPRVDYANNILDSKNTYNVTQIAKDYGLSARSLNSVLHDLGIQYKSGNQWVLYSKYQNKGYTESFTNKNENGYVFTNTKWTQKGRMFLYEILKENGYTPVKELN